MAISTAMLSACTANNNDVAENGGPYRDNGNTINVTDDTDINNNNGQNRRQGRNNNDNFGFVRQVKSENQGNTVDAESMQWLDWESMADVISRMAVSLPDIEDSSVLVTDQEVLIAYNTNQKDDQARMEKADQVKRTAMSVVPRWYHVYVTDDQSLRQNVENIASMNTTSRHKDETVRDTVRLMLERSPQGYKMSEGENANGEGIGEVNEDMDRTDYGQQMEKQKKNK